ncbi:hypothetical protein [Streptomyces sviceus]
MRAHRREPGRGHHRLGWQADDANYEGGLSSVTMDVTTWEKPEGAA